MIPLPSNSTIAPMSLNSPCRRQKLIGLILDRLNSNLGDKVVCDESTRHSHMLSILNFCLDRPFGFSAHQDTLFCPSHHVIWWQNRLFLLVCILRFFIRKMSQ